MADPDPPFPSPPRANSAALQGLAAAGLAERLRSDEPAAALTYLKVLEELRQAPGPPEPEAGFDLEAVAEALFTLAARLAFALVEAPETAPAVFVEMVHAWRERHLGPGRGGPEACAAARAALRCYLALSEADAERAARQRD
jgi:hypothetical protein